jgi:hypothetical protein
MIVFKSALFVLREFKGRTLQELAYFKNIALAYLKINRFNAMDSIHE